MRTVVKSQEVAHLWAHQTQPYARSSAAIFFEGDTIYSYGKHFPIARHVQTKRGKPAILFTTRGYSSSTAKHIGWTRRAIPAGVVVFEVYDPSAEPSVVDITRAAKRVAQLVVQAGKALIAGPDLIVDAQRLAHHTNRFAKAFGIKARRLQVVLTPALRKSLVVQKRRAAEVVVRRQAARVKAEAQYAQEHAARRAEALQAVAAWLAGTRNTLPGAHDLESAYARVEGSEIVTSLGARVSVAEVQEVAPVLWRYLASGSGFQANGRQILIGPYPLKEITADGTVVIGCHRFEKAEALRVLGLVEAV